MSVLFAFHEKTLFAYHKSFISIEKASKPEKSYSPCDGLGSEFSSKLVVFKRNKKHTQNQVKQEYLIDN